MANLSYRINSGAPALRGWRYLWLKTVKGFNPNFHCARCLVGKFDERFGLKAPINEDVNLSGYPEGLLLYFCGVAQPSNWANNAHLSGKVKKGAVSRIELYTRDVLDVHGLESISIDKAAAQEQFPKLGAEYLTCRNFQFGAKMFPALIT
jgi:hypothetical protein